MRSLLSTAWIMLVAGFAALLSVNRPPADPVTIKHNLHPFMKRMYGKAISGGMTLAGFFGHVLKAADGALTQIATFVNDLSGFSPHEARAGKAGLELKRQAGEKREAARTKKEALETQLGAQQATDFSGTKLTPAEIKGRVDEIQDLITESKALQDLDSIDGLMRNSEGASKGAREIFNDRTTHAETDADKKMFKSVGSFLRAVRAVAGDGSYDSGDGPLADDQMKFLGAMYKAGTAYHKGEPIHVKELITSEMSRKTLVGDDTNSAGRGDYLVPTEHMAELLRAMGEQQQFANRARRIPMTRRTIDFPRLQQNDQGDTRPIFSFAAISKIGEGVQKPVREPTFEQLVLTAIKYAAYLEASDELLADSIVDLPPVLVDLLTSAIGYEFDRDTMRGTGTSEPWGFVNHASAWVQNRKTASTVTLDDIFGLEERYFGGDTGIYLYHPSVLPKLAILNSSNVIVWHSNLAERIPPTLMGRPIVRSHKLPTLGAKGDLCLVDPMFYLVGDLQRITVNSSIHYKFQNDVTAWRAIFRAAGTPWPAGLFSYEASGGHATFRVSPFCVLGDAQTS